MGAIVLTVLAVLLVLWIAPYIGLVPAILLAAMCVGRALA